jgi:hypothetical protein
MKRVSALLLLGLLAARPLAGQTVIRPAPPLDSARAGLRDALLVLRDTLNTIDGAAARLQRDFRAASEPSLVSRARTMYQACARSGRTIPPTRQAVQDFNLNDPVKAKRRQELLGSMDRLKEAVVRCETEFAAMSRSDQGERVRGYGNDRAIRVQTAIRGYEMALRDFLGVMGIRVQPLGAGSRPTS